MQKNRFDSLSNIKNQSSKFAAKLVSSSAGLIVFKQKFKILIPSQANANGWEYIRAKSL